MTVALAGRAPATFEIKSASLPLVSLLLKSTDLQRLAGEWQDRFGELPDFFDHDPLVVDLAPLHGEGEVDFPQLVQLLKSQRVTPMAVRGGSEAQHAAAVAAGLVVTPDALTPARPQREKEEEPQEPVQVAAPTPAPPASALVIDRPLRSGQQVYARGRDLVVLAMVNPGAEVIADGHIHVYAPLRGKAIAGARGDDQARIFSLCLEPELVSIAGVYRTGENALPDTVRGKPAQVRLQGDTLVLQPLNT